MSMPTQELDLQGCSRLTDSGLVPLVRTLGARLIRLNIGGCRGATDHFMAGCKSGGLAGVQSLTLSSCLISDAGGLALCIVIVECVSKGVL